MAKSVGTFKREIKFLGIKIFDISHSFIQMSTEQDTEEIRDDIIMHELMMKNKNNIN
ncbi:hypothetical protein IJ182_07590 [bacterium]|nr:hypothetical protein [bacterium]